MRSHADGCRDPDIGPDRAGSCDGDHAAAEKAPEVATAFRRAEEEARPRRPLLGADDLYSADGPSMPYEWGMFPLSDDGERVSHCLAIEDHREIDRRRPLLRRPLIHSSASPEDKPRSG